MQRIDSPEQYDRLVEQAEGQGFSLTNCFFLPGAVRQKTKAGTLFFHRIECGLLLLDDNGSFYRCYYSLSPEGAPEPVALDRDAVIEFPFNGEMSEKQQRQVAMIEALGFVLGRESAMMSASPKAVCAGGATDGPCCAAQEQNADDILALLGASFNPLYAFLPDRDGLLTAINAGQVLVILEGDRVAAALVSGFEKKIATVNQVAVDPACRRRGYAGALMRAYHALYADRAAAFRHWVDVNNAPAVSLYRGLGYDFTLRKANEYIMLRKGEN